MFWEFNLEKRCLKIVINNVIGIVVKYFNISNIVILKFMCIDMYNN